MLQMFCYEVTCLQNHHCAPKGSWLPTVHSYRMPGKPQSQVHDQIPWPQAVQEIHFTEGFNNKYSTNSP